MGSVLILVASVCLLASFICGIIILIDAFQEEVVQGILCLCVPFYILYYAFARFENDNKAIILIVWLAGGIVGNVLRFMAAGGM